MNQKGKGNTILEVVIAMIDTATPGIYISQMKHAQVISKLCTADIFVYYPILTEGIYIINIHFVFTLYTHR